MHMFAQLRHRPAESPTLTRGSRKNHNTSRHTRFPLELLLDYFSVANDNNARNAIPGTSLTCVGAKAFGQLFWDLITVYRPKRQRARSNQTWVGQEKLLEARIRVPSRASRLLHGFLRWQLEQAHLLRHQQLGLLHVCDQCSKSSVFLLLKSPRGYSCGHPPGITTMYNATTSIIAVNFVRPLWTGWERPAYSSLLYLKPHHLVPPH